MQKSVCLCLMSLFDSLPNDDWRVRLTYDLWLIKTVQEETEYYDIISDDGTLLGCDGEIYSILEESVDYVTLRSDDAEYDTDCFTLSKKEFELTEPK